VTDTSAVLMKHAWFTSHFILCWLS